MKATAYIPTTLDFAYDIIALHEENEQLRSSLEHYKGMHEENMASMKRSQESTMENIGVILGAVLDPDSLINEGQRAITELALQEGKWS